MTTHPIAGICRSLFSHSASAGVWWKWLEGILALPKERTGEMLDDAAEAFVSAIKNLLQARACVQTSLSTADAILARRSFKSGGILLERIEVRKYTSWRNRQTHGPIRTLRYLESVLAELDRQNIKPDYWDYLRSRRGRIENLWIESHPKTEGAYSEPT